MVEVVCDEISDDLMNLMLICLMHLSRGNVFVSGHHLYDCVDRRESFVSLGSIDGKMLVEPLFY